MKCPTCGTRLSKEATFCHTCYTPIGAAATTGAPPPVSAAAPAAASPPPAALSAPVAVINPRRRAARRPRGVPLALAGSLAVALILVALGLTRPWARRDASGGTGTGTIPAIPLLSGDGSGGRWSLGGGSGATSVTSAQTPGCREGPCPGTMTVRFGDGRQTTVDDISRIAEIGQVDLGHYLAVAGFCELNCVVRVYGIDTTARAVTTVLDRAHPNPSAPGNPSYFPIPQGACGFTLTYRGATYTVRAVPDKKSPYFASWFLYGGDTACPSRGQYAKTEVAQAAAAATAIAIRNTPTVNGMAPTCLAQAGPGHLLIGDSASYVVWLANLTGRPVTLYGQTVAVGGIAPIAGKGGTGFGGDGGPATKAALYIQGCSLAVDKATNLYIADTNNYRVREVDARTGTIRTVAGGANPYLRAEGMNPLSIALSRGTLLVDDFNHARILAVDPRSGAMTTRATVPPLPRAVAADSADNLFVSANNRILKIDASTGAATTVAGNGTVSQGYTSAAVPATDGPIDAGSIAIDHAGNLLLSDDYLGVIRKVDLGAGTIATVAGVARQGSQGGFGGDGGPATRALLNHPDGLLVDSAGDLFIADTGNHRVRLVSARTGRITTVVGPTGGR